MENVHWYVVIMMSLSFFIIGAVCGVAAAQPGKSMDECKINAERSVKQIIRQLTLLDHEQYRNSLPASVVHVLLCIQRYCDDALIHLGSRVRPIKGFRIDEASELVITTLREHPE